jgi:hypothetical protein
MRQFTFAVRNKLLGVSVISRKLRISTAYGHVNTNFSKTVAPHISIMMPDDHCITSIRKYYYDIKQLYLILGPRLPDLSSMNLFMGRGVK